MTDRLIQPRFLWPLLGVLALAAQGAPLRLPAEDFALSVTPPGKATLTRVAAGTETVLRIAIERPTDPFYDIVLFHGIPPAAPQGTRLTLRFRARSVTRNPLRAVLEMKDAPYTGIAQTAPVLTPAWQDFKISNIARQDFPARSLALRFQVGHQTGTVELAGISLDMGPDPGWAAARAALKPAAVNERIDRLRKGTVKITVTRPDGRPAPGAAVHIAQTRHAFLFGANIFELKPELKAPWQRAYQERFTNLFNYATLPFYWGAFEARRGEPDYPKLDAMSDWGVRHGLTLKGHPLVWHEVWPDWAPRTPEAAIPLLRDRVAAIMARYRNSIRYWDVLNEANNAAGYASQSGEAAWIIREGAPAVVATALGWARKAGKGADVPVTLLYNDFNKGAPNVELLTDLQKQGALPDAIGLQSHMHSGAWPLEDVWITAEKFSRFGRPIHFTEVTVLSGPSISSSITRASAPSDPAKGEAEQADYVAAFYTALFSHPSLQAITWWDLSDRGAWKNEPSGLVRADMTPKPAYDRLMGLIHGSWWTDLKGNAGRDGAFTARVFGGEHDVTVTDAQGRSMTRHLTVPPAGEKTITLVLPD